MILIYRVFTNILYPFLFLFLFIRIFNNKEDPKRFTEKILVKSFNVKRFPDTKLLWFHAASIGEFKSIIPVIKQLQSKTNNYEFLITTNTLSSSELASTELRKFEKVHHRFMPFDVNFLIEKFLNLWKPERIFFVDSEIWPNLILKAYQKKIPIALLNARLTKKTFKRWIFILESAKKIFRIFDLCLCSNMETKNFLEKLNAKNIKFEGNIKLINEIDVKELNSEKNSILSKSRFWVAASIFKEEDILCLKTHIEVKKNYKDLITIIAPRHLDRVNKIKKLSNKLNLKTQILSNNDKIIHGKEIIIINSFGELPKYFQFAKSVFIGKSTIKRLKEDSGQNPIDAAKLGCKIYHGPYVYNFQETYDFLESNKISTQVENYNQLSKCLIIDLEQPGGKKNNYFNCIQILEKNILVKSMNIIEKFISNEIK